MQIKTNENTDLFIYFGMPLLSNVTGILVSQFRGFTCYRQTSFTATKLYH